MSPSAEELSKIRDLLCHEDLSYVEQGILFLETLLGRVELEPSIVILAEIAEKFEFWFQKKEEFFSLRIHRAIFKDFPHKNYIGLWSFGYFAQFAEAQKHIEKFTALYLGYGELGGLPNTLQNLKYIEKVYVYHNRFRAFPEVLLQLKLLKEIHISNNQIEFIPEGINGLTELEVLNIRNNPITELPDSLTALCIDREQWDRYKDKILSMKSIRYLSIGYNAFTAIPEEISQLENLVSLRLEQNEIQSLPDSIGLLQKLEVLILNGNLLEELPESFSNLRALKRLDLRRNLLPISAKMFTVFEQLESLGISNYYEDDRAFENEYDDPTPRWGNRISVAEYENIRELYPNIELF